MTMQVERISWRSIPKQAEPTQRKSWLSGIKLLDWHEMQLPALFHHDCLTGCESPPPSGSKMEACHHHFCNFTELDGEWAGWHSVYPPPCPSNCKRQSPKSHFQGSMGWSRGRRTYHGNAPIQNLGGLGPAKLPHAHWGREHPAIPVVRV